MTNVNLTLEVIWQMRNCGVIYTVDGTDYPAGAPFSPTPTVVSVAAGVQHTISVRVTAPEKCDWGLAFMNQSGGYFEAATIHVEVDGGRSPTKVWASKNGNYTPTQDVTIGWGPGTAPSGFLTA